MEPRGRDLDATILARPIDPFDDSLEGVLDMFELTALDLCEPRVEFGARGVERCVNGMSHIMRGGEPTMAFPITRQDIAE